MTRLFFSVLWVSLLLIATGAPAQRRSTSCGKADSKSRLSIITCWRRVQDCFSSPVGRRETGEDRNGDQGYARCDEFG
jgi:hypothetical protein